MFRSNWLFFLMAILVVGSGDILQVSATSKEQRSLELFSDVQNQINRLSGVSKACTQCNTHDPLVDSDVCTDLYEASCLNPNLRSNNLLEAEKGNAAVRSVIAQARLKATESFGFKSYDLWLRDKLKFHNLDVSANIDSTKLVVVTDNAASFSGASADEDFFVKGKECLSASIDFLGRSKEGGVSNDPTKGKQLLQDVYLFLSQKKEEIDELYALDIVRYFSLLKDGCSFGSSGASSVEREKRNALCSKMAEIQYEAMKIHALRPGDTYRQSSAAFVRRYRLADANTFDGIKLLDQAQIAAIGEMDLRSQITIALDEVSLVCRKVHSTSLAYLGSVMDESLKEINLSKPYIESLIDGFYPERSRAVFQAQFDKGKSGLKQLLPLIVKDKEKQKKLALNIDELELIFLDKPNLSNYQAGKGGVLMLDESAYSKQENFRLDQDLGAILREADGSFFFDHGAFYYPRIQSGVGDLKAGIFVCPKTSLVSRDSEGSVFQLLTHELGHSIDLAASCGSNCDLTFEFRGLTDCLASKESIGLKPNQYNEAIADFISAELVAKQLSLISPIERAEKLKSFMQFECIAGDDEFNDGGLYHQGYVGKESHPVMPYRISGIFGANPSIRASLGCKSESGVFRTCGIDGSTNRTEAGK